MGRERCPGWFEPFSLLAAKMFWLSHRRLVQMHTHELQPHITANYRNQMLSPVFGQRAQKSKSKTLSAGVAAEQPSTAQHSSSSGKQGDDPRRLPGPWQDVSCCPGPRAPCLALLQPWDHPCSQPRAAQPWGGRGWVQDPTRGQRVSLACGKLCGDGTTPTCWC